MPKYEITPASSPDVKCEFTIPVAGAKPIEFSVPRMDYIRNFDVDLADWASKRMHKTNESGEILRDEDGKAIADDDAGEISDREVIIAQLRIAGVNQKTIARLEKLTNGELSEVFKHWSEASRVSVGESQASEN